MTRQHLINWPYCKFPDENHYFITGCGWVIPNEYFHKFDPDRFAWMTTDFWHIVKKPGLSDVARFQLNDECWYNLATHKVEVNENGQWQPASRSQVCHICGTCKVGSEYCHFSNCWNEAHPDCAASSLLRSSTIPSNYKRGQFRVYRDSDRSAPSLQEVEETMTNNLANQMAF